jgi:hypothetical protein
MKSLEYLLEAIVNQFNGKIKGYVESSTIRLQGKVEQVYISLLVYNYLI